MGFCLLKNPNSPYEWLAINPAYINGVQQEYLASSEMTVCALEFAKDIDRGLLPPYVCGSQEELNLILEQATKLGIKTATLTVLTGKKKERSMPVQISNASRIVYIRELLPEEFITEGSALVTCSEIAFEDNTRRYVVERPGKIALLMNSRDEVPKFPL